MSIFSDPPARITEWSKRFGDTISVQYGCKLMVVMHDYDTAKRMFSLENTTGRDATFPLNFFAQGKGNVIYLCPKKRMITEKAI